MPELRKDPVTHRWVIISNERGKRPTDFGRPQALKKGGACPFCPGSESKTPAEILAIRPEGSQPNGPGWQVRVVPNKFPVLQVEGDLNRRGLGMFDMMNGIGAHEVIIDSPDHERALSDLEEGQVERILWTYRDRCLDLRRDMRLRYTLVFRNQGEAAGATLEHPHSQLIATPVVPSLVREKVEGALRYFEYKERCVYCDILRQELSGRDRLVVESEHFAALAPFASRFPFELAVFPKRHGHDFGQMDQSQAADLARVLKQALARLRKSLADPAYNYVIHTAPLQQRCEEEFHWHMEIIPRLTKIAGFEWGSGFYINPTPPE